MPGARGILSPRGERPIVCDEAAQRVRPAGAAGRAARRRRAVRVRRHAGGRARAAARRLGGRAARPAPAARHAPLGHAAVARRGLRVPRHQQNPPGLDRLDRAVAVGLGARQAAPGRHPLAGPHRVGRDLLLRAARRGRRRRRGLPARGAGLPLPAALGRRLGAARLGPVERVLRLRHLLGPRRARGRLPRWHRAGAQRGRDHRRRALHRGVDEGRRRRGAGHAAPAAAVLAARHGGAREPRRRNRSQDGVVHDPSGLLDVAPRRPAHLPPHPARHTAHLGCASQPRSRRQAGQRLLRRHRPGARHRRPALHVAHQGVCAGDRQTEQRGRVVHRLGLRPRHPDGPGLHRDPGLCLQGPPLRRHRQPPRLLLQGQSIPRPARAAGTRPPRHLPPDVGQGPAGGLPAVRGPPGARGFPHRQGRGAAVRGHVLHGPGVDRAGGGGERRRERGQGRGRGDGGDAAVRGASDDHDDPQGEAELEALLGHPRRRRAKGLFRELQGLRLCEQRGHRHPPHLPAALRLPPGRRGALHPQRGRDAALLCLRRGRGGPALGRGAKSLGGVGGAERPDAVLCRRAGQGGAVGVDAGAVAARLRGEGVRDGGGAGAACARVDRGGVMDGGRWWMVMDGGEDRRIGDGM